MERALFDDKKINEQWDRLFDYAQMLRRQISILEKEPDLDTTGIEINKRITLLSRIDALMDQVGLRGVEEYLDKVEKSLKRPREDEEGEGEDDKEGADGDAGFFEGGSGKPPPISIMFTDPEAYEDIERELLKKQKQSPSSSQTGFVFVPEKDWEAQMRQNQQEQPFNPPPGDAGPTPLFTGPLEPLRIPKTRRRTLGGKVKPGYYTNWKRPDPPSAWKDTEKKKTSRYVDDGFIRYDQSGARGDLF